jgi:hypothetical protein
MDNKTNEKKETQTVDKEKKDKQKQQEMVNLFYNIPSQKKIKNIKRT